MSTNSLQAKLYRYYQAVRQKLPAVQYQLGKLLLSDDAAICTPALGIEWLEMSSLKLLHHMSRIFQDNSPKSGGNGIRIDRKRLQKLREKKIALGQMADDHEEYTGPTLSM